MLQLVLNGPVVHTHRYIHIYTETGPDVFNSWIALSTRKITSESLSIFRTRHLYALDIEIPSEKHYSRFELLGLKALSFYSLSSNISKLDIFLYSLKWALL